jgi:DNA-binding response OmpR family regulator
LAFQEVKVKILVVDDDESILELLSAILESSGYSDISVCASPQEALAMIRNAETRYECLLFDINMPGMDGIELCQKVRALKSHKETPIVMLTAITDRTYIDRAFDAGATDYITKPFDVMEIGARLRIAAKLVTAQNKAHGINRNHTAAVSRSFGKKAEGITREEIAELFSDDLAQQESVQSRLANIR